MKTGVLLSAVVVFALASSSASFAAVPAKNPKASVHAQPAPKVALMKAAPVRVAPVDEYFGKMKMSPLGINNTIHDTSLRINYDKLHAARYYQALEWAENSLHDWAQKYPQDTWLPGRAYFMSHVFWQMHTPEADAAAERCRQIMFRQFPKSRWSVLAKSETKEKIAPVLAAESTVPAAQGVSNGAAAAGALAPAAASALKATTPVLQAAPAVPAVQPALPAPKATPK